MAQGPRSCMGQRQPPPLPTLTHSRVVLAQCLLTDGQGIIEQVGSLLVFVLVPGWAEAWWSLPYLLSELDYNSRVSGDLVSPCPPGAWGALGTSLTLTRAHSAGVRARLSRSYPYCLVLPLLPRAWYLLFSVPQCLCSHCSFCQGNLSQASCVLGKLTFPENPNQAMVPKEAVPTPTVLPNSSCAASSLVMFMSLLH